MAGGIFSAKRVWLFAGIPLLIAILLMAASHSGVEEKHMTALEARLSATLSEIDGAGKVRVMVLSGNEPAGRPDAAEVRGVIIVSDGAYDVGIQIKLQRAAMTLFSLPAERVEVFSGKEGN